MPFDSENYQPTDAILKALQDARQWLNDPALWAQENVVAFSDSRGRGCSLNWLGRVCANDMSIYSRASVWLERALPFGRYCIAAYNDHPATTHADVLALFDRAIAARQAELASELTRAA